MNLEERFWSKVNIGGEDDCWEWMAGGRGRGYGCFKYNSKGIDSHRMAWILTYGKIPNNLFILHKCDNRACCNPNHLFLGTNQDNVDDMVNKNRNAKGDNHGAKLHPESVKKGEENGKSKLTNNDVKNILDLYYNKKATPQEILSIYKKIARRTLYNIVSGTNWKHISSIMFPNGIPPRQFRNL